MDRVQKVVKYIDNDKRIYNANNRMPAPGSIRANDSGDEGDAPDPFNGAMQPKQMEQYVANAQLFSMADRIVDSADMFGDLDAVGPMIAEIEENELVHRGYIEPLR